MKTIKQLLRQPIKTAVGIVLVALAFAVLVTCVGQYTATDLTRKNLDDRYTTIALLAEAYTNKANTSAGYNDHSKLSGKLQDFLTNLNWKRDDILKTQSYTGLVSAYVPQLSIDNFSQYECGYYMGDYNDGYPYRGAMFEVKLEKIGTIGIENVSITGTRTERTELLNFTTYLCLGTVENVLGLEAGFGRMKGKPILLHIKVYDQEAYEALGLVVGQNYLVYGDDFVGDNDWAKKNSMYCYSADDIHTQPAHEELFGALEFLPGGFLYDYRPMFAQFDGVLTVCDPATIPIWGRYGDDNGNQWQELLHDTREYFYWDGERMKNKRVSTEEFAKYYQLPSIVPLHGSAEEFLASDEGALWREKLDEMEINNHSFPVLCVEKLGYQAAFAREQARIVEGRDFTEGELLNGEKVCIISQSVASKSGVKVGDTIELQTYPYDPNFANYHTEMLQGHSFPSSAIYSKRLGFDGAVESYTVVGLYRQEDAWQNHYDPYGFTPNTIFVPQSAMTSEMRFREKGLYTTLVLETGKQAEAEALAKEAGFAGLFICYDQGYSEIVTALDAYEGISQKALYIGLAGFSAVMLLFLFLYPNQQRRALRLMGTLGAPSWARLGHTFGGTLCILVPGALLGSFVGQQLWQRIASALMEWVNVEITLDADMSVIAPTLTAVGIAVTAVFALIISATLSRTRGLMKRK